MLWSRHITRDADPIVSWRSLGLELTRAVSGCLAVLLSGDADFPPFFPQTMVKFLSEGDQHQPNGQGQCFCHVTRVKSSSKTRLHTPKAVIDPTSMTALGVALVAGSVIAVESVPFVLSAAR